MGYVLGAPSPSSEKPCWGGCVKVLAPDPEARKSAPGLQSLTTGPPAPTCPFLSSICHATPHAPLSPWEFFPQQAASGPVWEGDPPGLAQLLQMQPPEQASWGHPLPLLEAHGVFFLPKVKHSNCLSSWGTCSFI